MKKLVLLGKIVRDRKTGVILKIEKRRGFGKLPVKIQDEFLYESREDFLKRIGGK